MWGTKVTSMIIMLNKNTGMELPIELISIAFKAPNNEFAWKKNDLDLVFNEFYHNKIAILGGEIWVILKNNNGKDIIYPEFTLKSGQSVILTWESIKNDLESWEDYVKRSIIEAKREIDELNVEENIIKKFRDKIFYNITFSNEQEFKELGLD